MTGAGLPVVRGQPAPRPGGGRWTSSAPTAGQEAEAGAVPRCAAGLPARPTTGPNPAFDWARFTALKEGDRDVRDYLAPLVGETEDGTEALLPGGAGRSWPGGGGFLEKTGRNRQRAGPCRKGERRPPGPRRARGMLRGGGPRGAGQENVLAGLPAGAVRGGPPPSPASGAGGGRTRPHRLARTGPGRPVAGRRGNCGHGSPALLCAWRRGGRTGPPWTGRWSGTPGGMTGGSPCIETVERGGWAWNCAPCSTKGSCGPTTPGPTPSPMTGRWRCTRCPLAGTPCRIWG